MSSEYRKEVRAAMKAWRAANPQYTDAKVVRHAWYGAAVFATQHYEFQFIVSLSDVLKAYRASLSA
jgi:hypothetical protein